MEFDCSKLNETFGIDGIQSITIETADDEYGYGIPSPRRTKCVYKGKEFDSMTEAAEHFGVTVGAVSLYVSREGCYRYELPVSYKGKTYKSISEAATLSGDKYQSVVNWINRHNTHLA